MSIQLLYLGPLRPDTLTLLEALGPAESAQFITPTANSEQWLEVQGLFPQAVQQVKKLAETSGEQPYYAFNLPEFNASQPASGLYTLYPGLELVDSTPQPLMGVADLLNELENQPSTIVVEQPELVWPLLQALKAHAGYKQLSELWLRVGGVPLYQGMPETEEILNWCLEEGFELQVTREDDPDLPLLQLTRHPFYDRWQEQAQRAAKLAKQLKAAQVAIEAGHNEQQEWLAQQTQWQQEREALKAQCAEQQQKLDALQAELAQQKALHAALMELHKDINKKFDEQHTFIKEVANALGQHITRRTTDL
ncbi:hypothetical protein [Vreelandella hamiltonii]|uniref:Uncharacterized protein n=1 Tax=Vreelandella hamiltonii TaxID=502829 RepID=A0A8H9I8B1_9GAMM|nr:hypothetical protein [Halomonas hamiltonii]ATH79328.1 hypothetical protein CLM76_17755 [Halomonas hydrothermalis]GGW41992.1 hypothetical protein GCM10007157_35420 [Halomonas hamiltonii]